MDNVDKYANVFSAPFTVRFSEYGGYDCMTSSYDVVNSNEVEVATVDSGRYGQRGCTNRKCDKTKGHAQYIADALNAYSVKEGK